MSRGVAVAIKREFGVSYHSIILATWYAIELIVRTSRYNDWILKKAVPASTQKANQEKCTIVFVNEAGFYLLPTVVRISTLRGKMLVLRALLACDHASAIGSITPDEWIFMQMQEHAYKARDVVHFYVCLRKIPSQLLVIWNRLPIHRAKVIK